jgi:hypothetical protein
MELGGDAAFSKLRCDDLDADLEAELETDQEVTLEVSLFTHDVAAEGDQYSCPVPSCVMSYVGHTFASARGVQEHVERIHHNRFHSSRTTHRYPNSVLPSQREDFIARFTRESAPTISFPDVHTLKPCAMYPVRIAQIGGPAR